MHRAPRGTGKTAICNDVRATAIVIPSVLDCFNACSASGIVDLEARKLLLLDVPA